MFRVGFGLLSAAAIYCAWFYGKMLGDTSMEFGAAGLGGNWLQRIGGMTLGAMLTSVLAYRITRARETEGETLLTYVGKTPDILFASLLLIAATSLCFVETVRVAGRHGLLRALDFLAYTFEFHGTYLLAALLFFSIRYAYTCWRRGIPESLNVEGLNLRRLAFAWFTLAVILAVGIPTLAAFSFSFWLGPWYRW